MPVPTVVLTTTLTDITNAANPGSVLIELVNFGANVPRISGTSILVQTQIPVQANGSGVFTSTIWRNDLITPASTYYVVRYLNSAGGEVASVPYAPFTADGTFNLSTLAPLVTIPAPPIVQLSFSSLAGNIAISQMNSGTGASSSTFWRGDGTWASAGGTTPFTPVLHQFLTGVNSGGVFSAAQPAVSDLSDVKTGTGSIVLATAPTLTSVNIGGSGLTVTAGGISVSPLIQFNGSISGNTQLQPLATASGVLTLPSATDTLTGKATTDIFTNKTLDTAGTGNVFKINGSQITAVTGSTQTVVLATSPTIFGGILYGGSTSGTTTLLAAAVASGTLTLPSATDTLVGKATTDIFTNKTLDTAGTGNVFKINGTQITANTGTGANVLATTPTLVTPVLGVATATSINKVALTQPASSATLTIADTKTLTASNSLTLAGSDATTITFQGTDTYVGRATTDIFTNKTFDTAGTGNVFKIAGTAISAITGSGAVVLANTPTLITPNIGAATGSSLALTGNISATRLLQDTSFANITPVTVTGVTAATNLMQLTIPAGDLNTVGRWYKVICRGVRTTGATAGTVVFALKIGTTTLTSLSKPSAINETNLGWLMEVDIFCKTTGASGTLEVGSNTLYENVSADAQAFTATVGPFDLTASQTLTLVVTPPQTTTSVTQRIMGIERSN